MAEFADRVLKLVTEPDYKPITLKAMSRRLKVAADDYAEFRDGRQGAGQGGQARARPGQDPAEARPLRRDHRALPPVVEGVRVRPAAHGRRRGPTRSTSRRTPAGDASSGDEVVVKITKRPKRPGMNVEGRIVQIVARASGLFVGTYFEDGGGRLRQDRRHDVPRPDLRRRPRGQGGQAGRQGRPRDRPLPDARTSRAKGSSPRSSASAGRRGSTRSPSSAPSTSPTPSTRRCSTRPASRPSTSPRTEIGDRLDLREVLTVTIDPATARDFDDAISLSRDERGYWSLGVHIADVSHFVRPASDARPVGPAAGHERLPARPRDPDAAGGPLEQPGEPPGRIAPATPSAPCSSSTPRAS